MQLEVEGKPKLLQPTGGTMKSERQKYAASFLQMAQKQEQLGDDTMSGPLNRHKQSISSANVCQTSGGLLLHHTSSVGH